MKVKAICPGSCGELLQGEIGDGEKLISYPIDLYTRVTIEEVKNPKRDLVRKKATCAIFETLDYFREDKEIGHSLELKINSNIPVEKGMASSTADIAATVVATAELLGKSLSCDELAKICTGIEPTDSTIFKNLTLFDHLKGRRIKSFPWEMKLDVLVLEPKEKLNTQDFRKNDYKILRIKNKEKAQKAYEIFQEGYKNKDMTLLGKAATISALANENILPKEELENIIEGALKVGALGVNVAHSGTALGIIFDGRQVYKDEILRTLKEKSINQFYYKAYFTKMVEGGVKILDKK